MMKDEERKPAPLPPVPPVCPRCAALESEVRRLDHERELANRRTLVRATEKIDAEEQRDNARALLRDLTAAVRAFFYVRKKIAAGYVRVPPEEQIETERVLYEVLRRVEADAGEESANE